MRNVLAIASREMRTYLTSPFSYVMIAAFALLGGVFFGSLLLQYGQMSSMSQDPFGGMGGGLNLTEHLVGPYYQTMFVVLLFIAPILTMRLVAEERKQRVIELLITSPVTSWEVVIGKFLGVFALFAVMQLLLFYQPATLFLVGDPDPGPLLTTYLGVLLLGGAYLAVGVAASALTENQIVAAVLAFSLLLIFWVIEVMSVVFAGGGVGGGTSAAEEVFKFLSLIGHFENFTKGVIDSRDAIYFASFIGFFLFLAQQRIESLRWR